MSLLPDPTTGGLLRPGEFVLRATPTRWVASLPVGERRRKYQTFMEVVSIRQKHARGQLSTFEAAVQLRDLGLRRSAARRILLTDGWRHCGKRRTQPVPDANGLLHMPHWPAPSIDSSAYSSAGASPASAPAGAFSSQETAPC